MAAVATDAVRNFDLSRAIEVLEELRGMGEGREGPSIERATVL
jgi:hypothetical protein